jgi:hypothetical protein
VTSDICVCHKSQGPFGVPLPQAGNTPPSLGVSPWRSSTPPNHIGYLSAQAIQAASLSSLLHKKGCEAGTGLGLTLNLKN